MKTFSYLTNMPKLEPLPTIEVDGKRFYISPNGIKLPSVTTVLGHFKKGKILEWRNKVGAAEADKITNRASTRGTKFHALMERYLCNENNIFEGVMPDMKQAFKDVKSTIDRIDNIHYIESPLYSEVIGLAGRTDVIAEFDGVPSIIDFKTSLRLKKEEWIDNYFEQGTAYSLMYEEMTGKEVHQVVVVISVDGEDKPQVFIKNRIDYIDSLTTKIKLYQEEHGYVC
jgi:genome maintenance exonuclease 1